MKCPPLFIHWRMALVALTCSALILGFTSCGRSPEQARKDLAALQIEFSVSSLVQAIKKGDEVAVKLLLESGIDVNGNDGAPLIAAVRKGSEPLVRDLIKRGAKVTSSDPKNYGPLDHAVEAGQINLVKLLINAGASVDPLAPAKGGFGNAFDLAEKTGKTEIADFFTRQFPISKEEANRALLTASMLDEPRLIKRYIRMGADLNHKNDRGDTALALAEEFKLENSLQYLKELAAGPTATTAPPVKPSPARHPEADKQFEEALTFYRGKQFPQALAGFLAAANKGHDQAQYNAGLMYAKGEGTEKDYLLAYQWFTKAAEAGVGNASQMRDKVLVTAKEALDAAFGQAQLFESNEAKAQLEKAKAVFEGLEKLEAERRK